MIPGWLGIKPSDGLLVDTNFLVLLAVGTVNRNRVETFKRTSAYTSSDFNLLIRCLDHFDQHLLTVPHVLAEVSNLTDLPGAERLAARHFLRTTISLLREVSIPSSTAASDPLFEVLGPSDAAIGVVAQNNGCAVLTDDLDLYVRLSHRGVTLINSLTCVRRIGDSDGIPWFVRVRLVSADTLAALDGEASGGHRKALTIDLLKDVGVVRPERGTDGVGTRIFQEPLAFWGLR